MFCCVQKMPGFRVGSNRILLAKVVDLVRRRKLWRT